MHFSLRDWVALLGFISLVSSVFSVSSPLASATPPQQIAPRKIDSQGMSGGMKPPASLSLNLDGRDIVTIYADGGIRMAEGLTPDEASMDFWRKVAELAPNFCRTQNAAKSTES
jgi:hypothetical protein